MGSFAQTNKCSKIVEKAPTKMADENEIRLRLADARAGEISMCSTALPLFFIFFKCNYLVSYISDIEIQQCTANNQMN